MLAPFPQWYNLLGGYVCEFPFRAIVLLGCSGAVHFVMSYTSPGRAIYAVGGNALSGGVGTVWGTLAGVIFIGVILNGMTLLGIKTDNQYIVGGAIVPGAVPIDRLRRR